MQFDLKHKIINRKFLSDNYNIDFQLPRLQNINQKKYNYIVNQHKEECRKLFCHKENGIGPGEVLLYYLYDKVELAGPTKSYDIIESGKTYEVKAVTYSEKMKCARNFFIVGQNGREASYKFIKNVNKLLPVLNIPKNYVEINKSILEKLKNLNTLQFEKLNCNIYKDGKIEYNKNIYNSIDELQNEFYLDEDLYKLYENIYVNSLSFPEVNEFIFLNNKNMQMVGKLDLNKNKNLISIDCVTRQNVKIRVDLGEMK